MISDLLIHRVDCSRTCSIFVLRNHKIAGNESNTFHVSINQALKFYFAHKCIFRVFFVFRAYLLSFKCIF
jgi:hypothetical protein